MSTPRTAQVYITNTTDGTAAISIWHNNKDYGTESSTWTAAPGQRVGPWTVHFNTGFGSFTVLDYWACEIHVTGGSTPGLYESSGVFQYSDWKECQLQSADAGRDLTFTVNTRNFAINLRSGGCNTPMNAVNRVSAQVYLTNKSDGHATMTLFHNNGTDGTQIATWSAAPGAQVGPLTVYFRLGLNVALVLDYWAVKIAIRDGSTPGIYESVGSWVVKNWKECQLQSADAGKNLAFTVDTKTFSINLPSGSCQAKMNRVSGFTVVDNVFVLMLENHSFDNVFAFSGIKGITAATSANTNSFLGQSYAAAAPAPSAMPTDPGHEFPDVLEQLCGDVPRTPWQPYNEPVVNTGFVANYATTKDEITTNNPNRPTPAQYGDIMKCFDTRSQLPVIYELATTFAICDHWYSSIPGPTWPNRFFVHGASSGGWADSPKSTQIVEWETVDGFRYPSGSSIYDKLAAAGLQWRIYVDENGPVLGGIPQVAALKGIMYEIDTNNFGSFASEVSGPYPYTYTFIEPNYGDVEGGSYKGGSSQHPTDSMARGEALIKAAYEAIRNSPLWERSVLIITYDEHGGFYDRQPPPTNVPNPGTKQDWPTRIGHLFLRPKAARFNFEMLGPRVPAVVISPYVPRGTVDTTVRDHSSVPRTVRDIFAPHADRLTARDAWAQPFHTLLSLDAPRRDDLPDLSRFVAPTAPGPRTGAMQGSVSQYFQPFAKQADNVHRRLLRVGEDEAKATPVHATSPEERAAQITQIFTAAAQRHREQLGTTPDSSPGPAAAR